MASYSLILHVMQTEELSYIVAVRQSSVLLAVLVGWFWLREPQDRQRVSLAALICTCVVLVVRWG
ncbi:MAG: hypothetical protein OEZ06_31750 [Myxococcales bacterium]|nr:hypothetical protein [Myxococcales bacterium]